MKTLEIDDEELTLLLAAVRSYLDDFGHEEADVLRRVKQLLAKLQAAHGD
jgi:negative regulator of replication initiation